MTYPEYLAVFDTPLDPFPVEIVKIVSTREFNEFVSEWQAAHGGRCTFTVIDQAEWVGA